MSDLSPKARALIQTNQFADEPSQADYDRVHSALEARIALGVAAGVAVTLGAGAAMASTTGAATSAVAGAATGTAVGAGAVSAVVAAGAGAAAPVAAAPVATAVASALAVKVAAWAVVVGAVAVGTTAVVRHETKRAVATHVEAREDVGASRAVPAESRGAKRVAEAPKAAEPGANAGANPVDTPPAIADSTTTTTTTPTSNTMTAGSTSAPAAKAVAARVTNVARGNNASAAAVVAPEALGNAPVVTTPLDDEIALLRSAREALRDGQASRALEVLDEHARRFPNGALAEDRAAERVFVLCALGRTDEARAEGANFLTRYARSSHAASVRASCGKN